MVHGCGVRGRVDSQDVRERGPTAQVDAGRRIRVAEAVVAGHRRPGGPLVGRLGGEDVLGGTDRLGELAEVETALGEIHLGLRAAGPMVLARPLRPFGVGLVGEEIVGAQVERGLQRGPSRFAHGARGGLQQGVEPVEVDRELVGADAVAAGLRPDHLAPDGPAQQRHVGLDRGGRRPRLVLAPQVLGNAILRNGSAAAEEQDLQQLPGLDAAEIPWAEPAARDVERQRSQHPDRHWPSCTRHIRSSVHGDGNPETVGQDGPVLVRRPVLGSPCGRAYLGL